MISTHTPRINIKCQFVLLKIMDMGIGGKKTWTSSYNNVSEL